MSGIGLTGGRNNLTGVGNSLTGGGNSLTGGGDRLTGGGLIRSRCEPSRLNRLTGLGLDKVLQECGLTFHKGDKSVQFGSDCAFRACHLTIDSSSSAFRVENAFSVAFLTFFRLRAIVRELVI